MLDDVYVMKFSRRAEGMGHRAKVKGKGERE
jgi:hypothetical protein